MYQTSSGCNRLLEVRDVHVADLEATQRDRRHGPVRVGEEVGGIGLEVGQRVADVGALLAGEEDVLGVVLLGRAAERQGVLLAELGEAVLELERVVAQLVVRREGLEPNDV